MEKAQSKLQIVAMWGGFQLVLLFLFLERSLKHVFPQPKKYKCLAVAVSIPLYWKVFPEIGHNDNFHCILQEIA